MSNKLPDGLADALNSKVRQEFGQHRVTGLSVALVVDGDLVWSQGYGYADLESGQLPDSDTVFRVASITKPFTATGIFQLRDQGKLSIDDPLTKYIPEFGQVKANVGSVEQVTLRRIMCHHSGLMTESPGDYWETLDSPTMQEVLDKLPETAIVIEADSAFKYSNLAFALLGEVVSRVSGSPYAEYIKENILTPLGMTSSDFRLTDAIRSNLATGYQAKPYEDYPDVAPHPDFKGLTAAGQLYSTVEDLAKWIGFQVGERGDDVLSAKSRAEMQRPQFLEPGWRSGRCLPWGARRFGDDVYLGHSGGIPGFLTTMMFSPVRKIGAVALTNSDEHTADVPISKLILDTYLVAMDSVAKPAHREPPQPTPSAYREFLGVYSTAMGFGVSSIQYRGGKLALVLPGPPDDSDTAISLEPTADSDVFVATEDELAGEELRFNRNPDGTVIEFQCAGYRARRLVEA
ncbi:MAG: beta-lactamase family protein [Chloroflexi bacterium]|nr:beta-lactamase family protein [Chloroflexota bacterium]